MVADSYRYVKELYDLYSNYNFFDTILESRALLFFQGSYTMPNNNVFLVYYLSKLSNNLNIFYFVNLIIYSFLLFQITSHMNKKQALYFILFLTINVYILGSFSLPNKEIFGYFAILSLVGYLLTKKLYFLIISIIISLFSRIVLTYFLFCIACYINFFSIFKFLLVKYCSKLIGNLETKKLDINAYIFYSLTGLGLLLYVSNIIYIKVHGSSYILYSFNNENEFSLNIFLHELSINGLSYLTIWIKILENLFAGVLSSEPLLSTENYLNRYSEYIHLFLLSILVFFVFKNRYSLRYKKFFLSVAFIYLYFLIIFSMQSFIMHRYVAYSYPILIYLLLILICDNSKSHFKNHNSC